MRHVPLWMMVEEALTPRPLDRLQDYSVFTDCSFRSATIKYQRGGRMGIAGVVRTLLFSLPTMMA